MNKGEIHMLMVGKSGFITAAGSGIGRASAVTLAKHGASVVVSDINEEAGQETVQLIEDAGGTASFFYCNAMYEEEIKALVDFTVTTYGKIDFAHNNAGVSLSQEKIGETDSDAWDKTIQITLYSTFYSIKHTVNAMKETGGGAIVNTVSTAGIEGVANMAPYVASKHGVTGITKAAALEYGRDNIRVNGIAPGSTLTAAIESWREYAPDQYEAVLKSIPSGEMAMPEDQANAVLYLCSALANKVSGVIIPVDSGYAAGKFQEG